MAPGAASTESPPEYCSSWPVRARERRGWSPSIRIQTARSVANGLRVVKEFGIFSWLRKRESPGNLYDFRTAGTDGRISLIWSQVNRTSYTAGCTTAWRFHL